MNDLILSKVITPSEIIDFSRTDIRWANQKKKKKNWNSKVIKKGQIYQFDFGKNYIPEMSYEHRGMIIGGKGKLLYVLPIFSYLQKYQKDVYDCVANSTGNLFFLSSVKYPFLKRDSLLKLNDIRTVSIDRILYFQDNGFDIKSELYKTIIRLVFEKYFPDISYQFKNMEEENENQKNEIEKLQIKLVNLENEVMLLKERKEKNE